jgi:DNA mismatch repair protein MutS2
METPQPVQIHAEEQSGSAVSDPILQAALQELEFPKVIEQIAALCSSELGREYIRALAPREDLPWLRAEHETLQEMVELLEQGLPFGLGSIPDVRRSLRKSTVENALLLPTELVDIRELLVLCRSVRQELIRLEQFPHLRQLGQQLYQNRLLERHINDTVDETGAVRDTASRELARIREEMRAVAARLRSRLRTILRRFVEDELAMDEFITQREGRFVVPIRVEHKHHIPGIIHGVSQTGATVFLEPAEIFELNNELALLADAERREIERILRVLTAEVGSCAHELLHSEQLLGYLDSLLARARYAQRYGGRRPVIGESEEIVVRDIVHPLLAAAHGRAAVVPLSLEFRAGLRGHLISGPNAGGKTVALKSVGLNLLLAFSGIFPLGECRTPLLRIMTAIGDQQSIEQNLSTFSWQIVRLREILQRSTPQSLVLVDEICAGTDPSEGAALAMAILEELLRSGARFIVTTHQSSLKVFALRRAEVQNDSLAFDQERLLPTYRFLPGVPGNSYAFVIARNFGLPEAVVQRAQELLGGQHRALEEGIAAVEQLRAQLEQAYAEAERERQRAEELRRQSEQQLQELRLYRAQLRARAREEFQELLAQARQLIESTLRELRGQQRPAEQVRREFAEAIEQLQQTLRPEPEELPQEQPAAGSPLSVGSWVRMEGMQSVGTIVELDTERGIAVVDFGGLKLRSPVEKLQAAEPPPRPARSAAEYVRADAPHSLDLRGRRVAEALQVLERFLNQALQAGAERVRIVHGTGTGALRQALHEFLRRHPAVAEFRNAEPDEGGAGTTIVVLR